MAYKTTTPRPEPEAFSFRPQLPGESPAQYKDLKGKAHARFKKRGGGAGTGPRGAAIKGMLRGKLDNC